VNYEATFAAALAIVVGDLKASEGFRAQVYDDSTGRRVASGDCNRDGARFVVRGTGGIATVGYGETLADVVAGAWRTGGLSEGHAAAWLAEAVERRYFAPIRPPVTVTLNPNQWAALVSLAYNIGTGGFVDSTVLRVVNDGLPAWGSAGGGRLRDAFLMWAHPESLRPRRLAEVRRFFTPWAGFVPRPSRKPKPEVMNVQRLDAIRRKSGHEGHPTYDVFHAWPDGFRRHGAVYTSTLHVYMAEPTDPTGKPYPPAEVEVWVPGREQFGQAIGWGQELWHPVVAYGNPAVVSHNDVPLIVFVELTAEPDI